MQRKDDKNKQKCYRGNRMVFEGGAWFFKTRDGGMVGPFEDELQASTQLEVYIRMVDSGLMPAEDFVTAVKSTA